MTVLRDVAEKFVLPAARSFHGNGIPTSMERVNGEWQDGWRQQKVLNCITVIGL